jgi:choline-sulfatase
MSRKPNILIIMVDQLNGLLFPDGPADWLHAPNLKRLAERSRRYEQAYCASPLCAPSRAAFMTGQLPSRTGVYDNAAEFASSIPTFAHHLRLAGYRTCLSGKMHFVGPDQLHGFEERLTTDIYPADYGWTPDWSKPGERIDWWYHNMGSVTSAGVAEITNQMEYDDEVAHFARAWIYDAARTQDRPWCLTASFTHPHDPYVARREYWDLYQDCAQLMPGDPMANPAAMDAHSQRIFAANDWAKAKITEAHIQSARRAYFANITYVDTLIGSLLKVLDDTGQEAVVVFTSDHGDMLGEHGLWYKMSFRDGAARVPLMIAAPGLEPGLSRDPVSLLDLMPTMAEIAGGTAKGDGESLLASSHGPVRLEYMAEASIAPMLCHIEDGVKLELCPADPDRVTLAAGVDPGVVAKIKAKALAFWDIPRIDAEVRESQQRRLLVNQALRSGGYYPWDYQPLQKASERYMRNHMDLNVLEANKRFPRST